MFGRTTTRAFRSLVRSENYHIWLRPAGVIVSAPQQHVRTKKSTASKFKATVQGKAKSELLPKDVLSSVKKTARAKFDETIDVAVNLNLDTRKADQNLRVSIQLPHGTGKKVKVAVFAVGDLAEEARDAGAHVVGAEELVQEIKENGVDFDRCIASPDMMPLVGQIARVLGPRGLMPNPKVGTLRSDVGVAVKEAMHGQVHVRADKFGIVHAPIGKVSFPEDKLFENLRTLMVELNKAKPTGAPKSQYVKNATISSTMGPGFKIEGDNLSPAANCMRLIRPE